MLNLLITAILVGWSSFYFTNVLTYDFSNENHNTGPFKSKNGFVYNTLTMQTRPINLFDCVRMVTGLYKALPKEKGTTIWNLNEAAVDGLWACPHCLNFWLSFIFTMLFTRLFESPSFMDVAIITCAASGICSFLIYKTGAREDESV